jgi:dienelactone hydrolase
MSSVDADHPIEQDAGAPLVPAVDPRAVDQLRRQTYESYEAFLRERLLAQDAGRPGRWARDYTDAEAYLASTETMRQRFKDMLGFWVDPGDREPVCRVGAEILLEQGGITATRFTYQIAPGLETYALALQPAGEGPHPGLLIQHGYMGTPELACGLTAGANEVNLSYRSMGWRAALKGYYVIAPHHPSGYGTDAVSVEEPLPGHQDQSVHYGKNRLHRLCVLQGGTLLGLDMLASSRAVDLLLQEEHVDGSRVGMYGLSRGGQTALFLPALDQRLRASVCSAYFNTRLEKLIGPYRCTNYVDWFAEGQFLPRQVGLFGDADIVSLIAPRAFAAEAGALDSAVDQQAAAVEAQLAQEHYRRLGIPERFAFIPHAQGHVAATARAFEFLGEQLRMGNP